MKKYLEHALTGEELLNLVNGKANLVTYTELKKYNSIDEAIAPYEACIILYETRANFGHWCCVIKRGDTIEHFDSYGLMPDDELKYVPNIFRKQNNMDFPLLTYLLINMPPHYKIEYNEYKLQSKEKGINTCGRWVGTRINNKNMLLEEYVKYFKDKDLTPDEIVVLNTI